MIRYIRILALQMIKTHLCPRENRLQQALDKKHELQIIWRIIKTHSTNRRVSETLQQNRLQRERDENDQVHTNTTFANDLNSLSYKEDDSGVSLPMDGAGLFICGGGCR